MKQSLKQWVVTHNREDMLLYYDYSNNPTPDTISKGSHQKLLWRCTGCGKAILKEPHQLTEKSLLMCTTCTHNVISEQRHKAAVKRTNFAEHYPLLAEEWDAERNELKADEVSYNSNRDFYWICKRCGTSFKSIMTNRIKGSQCPRCSAIWHTSFPEQAVYYYIKNVFSDAELRDNSFGREIDIYIPSIKTGIEYDGVAWHRKAKHHTNDTLKEKICKENGIRLIRIREKGLADLEYMATTDILYLESGNEKQLEKAIVDVCHLLNIDSVDVDLNRDRNTILASFISAKKDNSLSLKYPDLAKEWDYDKNVPLTPEDVDYGSGVKAWWICSVCGYEFQTSPNARTCKNSGCPACANQVLFVGSNDFITWCKCNGKQQLLDEWDYERNIAEGIDINRIIGRGGENKAYWICKEGHHYKQKIYDRTIGKGCQQCAHIRRLKRCRNIDTGEVFNSLKEAGAHYKISPSKISMVCKGERKTAAGYHWEFV